MLKSPTLPPANLPAEASALQDIIARRRAAADAARGGSKPATPFNSAI